MATEKTSYIIEEISGSMNRIIFDRNFYDVAGLKEKFLRDPFFNELMISIDLGMLNIGIVDITTNPLMGTSNTEAVLKEAIRLITTPDDSDKSPIESSGR